MPPGLDINSLIQIMQRLYRGEGGVGGGARGGDWWTRNPARAASHMGQGGQVLQTDVPLDVAKAGQQAAQQAGSGTAGDVLLPLKWLRQAVPTNIQRPIVDLGGTALGALNLAPIPMDLINQLMGQMQPQG